MTALWSCTAIPRCRLNIIVAAPSLAGLTLWNALPVAVREVNSVTMFKGQCDGDVKDIPFSCGLYSITLGSRLVAVTNDTNLLLIYLYKLT